MWVWDGWKIYRTWNTYLGVRFCWLSLLTFVYCTLPMFMCNALFFLHFVKRMSSLMFIMEINHFLCIIRQSPGLLCIKHGQFSTNYSVFTINKASAWSYLGGCITPTWWCYRNLTWKMIRRESVYPCISLREVPLSAAGLALWVQWTGQRERDLIELVKWCLPDIMG